MPVSDKLAIAAHMHVLLRRKTGRVTDTEWMAENLDYAREIVRFARAKAQEDGHPDLAEWAGKLERAVIEPPAAAPKPLVQTAVEALRKAAPSPAPGERPSGFGASLFGNSSGFSESTLESGRGPKRDPDAPRYVGGIR